MSRVACYAAAAAVGLPLAGGAGAALLCVVVARGCGAGGEFRCMVGIPAECTACCDKCGDDPPRSAFCAEASGKVAVLGFPAAHSETKKPRLWKGRPPGPVLKLVGGSLEKGLPGPF